MGYYEPISSKKFNIPTSDALFNAMRSSLTP